MTGMVFPVFQPVWEETFPTVRHMQRTGSGPGIPSMMHGHTGDRTKRTMKTVKGLEHLSHKEKLRELSVEEKRLEGILTLCINTSWEGLRMMAFSVVSRDRTHNEQKLKYGKFYLSARKKGFFTVRMVRL